MSMYRTNPRTPPSNTEVVAFLQQLPSLRAVLRAQMTSVIADEVWLLRKRKWVRVPTSEAQYLKDAFDSEVRVSRKGGSNPIRVFIPEQAAADFLQDKGLLEEGDLRAMHEEMILFAATAFPTCKQYLSGRVADAMTSEVAPSDLPEEGGLIAATAFLGYVWWLLARSGQDLTVGPYTFAPTSLSTPTSSLEAELGIAAGPLPQEPRVAGVVEPLVLPDLRDAARVDPAPRPGEPSFREEPSPEFFSACEPAQDPAQSATNQRAAKLAAWASAWEGVQQQIFDSSGTVVGVLTCSWAQWGRILLVKGPQKFLKATPLAALEGVEHRPQGLHVPASVLRGAPSVLLAVPPVELLAPQEPTPECLVPSPAHTEVDVLPADDPKARTIGFSMVEKLGIGIVNIAPMPDPFACAHMSSAELRAHCAGKSWKLLGPLAARLREVAEQLCVWEQVWGAAHREEQEQEVRQALGKAQLRWASSRWVLEAFLPSQGLQWRVALEDLPESLPTRAQSPESQALADAWWAVAGRVDVAQRARLISLAGAPLEGLAAAVLDVGQYVWSEEGVLTAIRVGNTAWPVTSAPTVDELVQALA